MWIYESNGLNDEIPSGFDALTVSVNGKVTSTLEWNLAQKRAKEICDRGMKVFFEIDLGLFSDCPLNFSPETWIQTLQLSLEHFSETLWSEFSEDMVGISLYQGPPFLTTLEEEDPQVEMLQRLAAFLPEEPPTFLFFDASQFKDPLEAAENLSSERFSHFTLAVKGGGIPPQAFAWQEGMGPLGYIGTTLPEKKPLNTLPVAVCLPAFGRSKRLSEAIESLNKQGFYRMIPESQLTGEWHGLDFIVVDPETLSSGGRRKLMGFCAAGGTVVYLGEPLNLPHEIAFTQWSIS